MVRTHHRLKPKLTVVIISSIRLIQSSLLPDFPSGSSINYYEGKFYLIGDDATSILVLDTLYRTVDSVPLFDYPGKRIPKPEKVDLESAAIFDVAGTPHLVMLGSASRPNRQRILLVPFQNHSLSHLPSSRQQFRTGEFIDRLTAAGIREINLEGFTKMKDSVVIGNRGNRAVQENHLIVTGTDFWLDQAQTSLQIRKVMLPPPYNKKPLGLSELHYIEALDLLLMAFTSEDSSNSYDDGEIGNSYIGWIERASHKLKMGAAVVDNLLNLAEVDESLQREKVEGICIESMVGNEWLLHLTSDNDAGETKLFKIQMTVEFP